MNADPDDVSVMVRLFVCVRQAGRRGGPAKPFMGDSSCSRNVPEGRQLEP